MVTRILQNPETRRVIGDGLKKGAETLLGASKPTPVTPVFTRTLHTPSSQSSSSESSSSESPSSQSSSSTSYREPSPSDLESDGPGTESALDVMTPEEIEVWQKETAEYHEWLKTAPDYHPAKMVDNGVQLIGTALNPLFTGVRWLMGKPSPSTPASTAPRGSRPYSTTSTSSTSSQTVQTSQTLEMEYIEVMTGRVTQIYQRTYCTSAEIQATGVPATKDPEWEKIGRQNAEVLKEPTLQGKINVLKKQGCKDYLTDPKTGLTVLQAPPDRREICTDLTSFKTKAALAKLNKLPKGQQVRFGQFFSEQQKICTTVATHEEHTYNGKDQGVILYLHSPERYYMAFPCDSNSPTTYWNTSDPMYQKSSDVVDGYMSDQERDQTAFYLLDHIKAKFKELIISQAAYEDHFVEGSDEHYKSMADLGRLESGLERIDYMMNHNYLSDKHKSNALEADIEYLIEVAERIQFLDVKPLLDQLRQLDASVKQIVNDPDVLDRASCKLKNSNNEVPIDQLAKNYPLTALPEMLKTIDNNFKKVVHSSSSAFESTVDVRRRIRDTLTKKREGTFDYSTAKQITPGGTVTQTLEYQKKYIKEKTTKIKYVQDKIKPLLGTDPEARELNEQCNQALKMLDLYNEVQIKAKSADIVAIGVKDHLATQAMSSDYAKNLVEHNKKKQFVIDAPELLKKATDPFQMQWIYNQVDQCTKDIEAFDHVVYTREVIEKASDQGIPVIAYKQK